MIKIEGAQHSSSLKQLILKRSERVERTDEGTNKNRAEGEGAPEKLQGVTAEIGAFNQSKRTSLWWNNKACREAM